MSVTLDFQTVLLALIAAVPPTVTAWLAYRKADEAKQNAVEAKTLGSANAVKLDEVGAKTDGMSTALAEATRKEGFGAGVKQEQDAAAITAAEQARQAELIEAIVARVLAAQPSGLVKANGDALHADPGPVAAKQISDIKEVVEDVQPRVIAIEEATATRDAAVERVATGADERLTKLEEKAPDEKP